MGGEGARGEGHIRRSHQGRDLNNRPEVTQLHLCQRGGLHFNPFSATSFKIYLPLTVLSSALRATITPLAYLGYLD